MSLRLNNRHLAVLGIIILAVIAGRIIIADTSTTPLNPGHPLSQTWIDTNLNMGSYNLYTTGNVKEGTLTFIGQAVQPALSAPNGAVMYLDSATKDIMVSINGNPYVSLASGATVPAQITSLTAIGGDAQISLSWSAPSDGGRPITGYRIYRGSSSGSETYLTATATASFVDTGLTGGAYYYKVSAVNAIGEGSLSNEASFIFHVQGQQVTDGAWANLANFGYYSGGNIYDTSGALWALSGGKVTKNGVYATYNNINYGAPSVSGWQLGCSSVSLFCERCQLGTVLVSSGCASAGCCCTGPWNTDNSCGVQWDSGCSARAIDVTCGNYYTGLRVR